MNGKLATVQNLRQIPFTQLSKCDLDACIENPKKI